jgi:DNA-binding transcriptional regulator YbjK
VAAARAALRTWTRALLHTRVQHAGLVRALYALAAHDPEFRRTLELRRNDNARRLEGWLRDLAARGIIALPQPNASSTVLFTMLDGIGREAVAAGEPLEERLVDAAVGLVERAVFGS